MKSSAEEPAVRPIVLEDDRSSDPMLGKLRFVHTSPDAPAVDIALAGGGVVIPNVSFRETSTYLGLEPGVYDLEVRLAGTSDVALPLPGVTITAGVNATAFAVGLVGDMTLGALIAADINDNFIRGDANLDGDVDVADPVATLIYLFVDPKTEVCDDAADANDDGHVDVGDAIYTLSWLFQGGADPAMPFPDAGTDPTADHLGCRRAY